MGIVRSDRWVKRAAEGSGSSTRASYLRDEYRESLYTLEVNYETGRQDPQEESRMVGDSAEESNVEDRRQNAIA